MADPKIVLLEAIAEAAFDIDSEVQAYRRRRSKDLYATAMLIRQQMRDMELAMKGLEALLREATPSIAAAEAIRR